MAKLDDILREGFCSGDRGVLERVWRETFAVVQKAVGTVLRNRSDRDQVTNDVFTELLSKRELRESYRGDDFHSWLSGIARHKAIDYWRREHKRTARDENASGPDGQESRDLELMIDLRRFMAALPDELRRVVDLCCVQGLNQSVAAGQAGIPRMTLADRLRKAKRLWVEFVLGQPTPPAEGVG